MHTFAHGEDLLLEYEAIHQYEANHQYGATRQYKAVLKSTKEKKTISPFSKSVECRLVLVRSLNLEARM